MVDKERWWRVVEPLAGASVDAEDTVIVVTGAARGIGAELALTLGRRGATIVVADVLEEEGAARAEQLRSDGLKAVFLRVDVGDEQDVLAFGERCVSELGRIDGLVNNAGLFRDLGPKRAFSEISLQEWEDVMRINARGPWLMTKAVVPTMRRQGFGRIVNMASATVHMGITGFVHYVASKGALIAMTRSLAKELGPSGITVNAVAPGLVRDEAAAGMNAESYFEAVATQRAVQRDMLPGDLSGVVGFLCSRESGFLTGQTIIVDGGVVFS